jgi:hypothetical protein
VLENVAVDALECVGQWIEALVWQSLEEEPPQRPKTTDLIEGLAVIKD